MGFIFFFFVSIISYLVLTAGSGTILFFWSIEELIVGTIISIVLAFVGWRLIPDKVTKEIINPLRWIGATFYMIGPFFISLMVANIEVLYRIITGRIKPAIIKIETDLKSDSGNYFLANSITLSPGTLTIYMEEETNDLYIHCLHWDKPEGHKATTKDSGAFIYFWMKLIFG
jgi:multicomponent Na+:H+ antiporter subunit E